MKTYNSTVLATMLALAASMPEKTEARSYGSLLAPPRAYQYSRPRDPFDLVSQFFQTPFYNLNSMMKQQHAAADRLAHSTSPRYAVSEEDGVVQLEVEVPGVHANDIDVELEDNSVLRIKGSRKHSAGSSTESSFDLSFQLAEGVDPDRLTVKLSNGILSVQVPKKEKTVKKLPVIATDDDAAEELLKINSVQDSSGPEGQQEEVVDGITISEEAAED